jgi:hypothetical protein
MEEEIVPGCNRQLHVRKRRHAYFGKERREAFLAHLAATCNVTASAEAAGVRVSTVYAHRMRDTAFRETWALALEQGYARLEAALIERASRGIDRAELHCPGDARGPDGPTEIEWDKAMQLLRHHQLGLAGSTRRNRAQPVRVPVAQLADRLIRKLRALGVRPDEREEAASALPPPGGAEG